MFRYSEERKNAVIQKMLPPQSVSVADLSKSEGLCTKTLYRWRKEAVAGGNLVPDRRSSSDKFSAEAKFAIVVETATLSEHDLSEYCRERGLFPEQVKDWKQCFIQGVTPAKKQVKADQSALKKERTAQANQIRGLLTEYGIMIPQGISHITKRLPEILEDGENELPGVFRQLLQRLGEHLRELGRQVDELDVHIQVWHRENVGSQKLAQIPGIGLITASVLIASIGDAKCFKNGRQLAPRLGLVPRQHSSGGKPTLLGTSKRGGCLSTVIPPKKKYSHIGILAVQLPT